MEHKIVVVGCGAMANIWIDYAMERQNTEIVALVDLDEKVAQSKAKEKGLEVSVFTDLSEAIKETNATLVFDVTIPAAHKKVVSAAVKAGCDVFGEKPMAESLEDAKDVWNIVEENNRVYNVMQNRRYLKQIRTLRKMLDDSVIGGIGSMHADFFLGPHFGGFRETMAHPLILDMAIHTFDQARFISNADPISVYCHSYNTKGSWFEGDASAICIFEMSDGSVFHYKGSWSAEGYPTSWESDWRIVGEEGTIRWNGEDDPAAEVIDKSMSKDFFRPLKKMTYPSNWNGKEGHFGCLDEMFQALEENRPAETNYKDNYKSMQMVFGAIESAEKEKKIIL